MTMTAGAPTRAAAAATPWAWLPDEKATTPRAFFSAVSRLMADCGAEYADCYCWGIPAQTMAEAGFCARTEDDLNIIPNYLTPPLCENTEYYFFTSEPAAFTMFKADGDQDRPNIRVE